MDCRLVECAALEQAAAESVALSEAAVAAPEAQAASGDGLCERCERYAATAGRACLFCPANAI